MDEFIKKLIERLEEEKEKIEPYLSGFTEDMAANQIIGLNAAIKIVTQLAEEYKDAEVLNMAQMTADYNKAKLEELKRISNGGWIACSERLPEEYGDYICDTETPYGNSIQTVRFDEHGFWVNVNAWQPLPAPYKPTTEQPDSISEAWKQQTMSRFERVE